MEGNHYKMHRMAGEIAVRVHALTCPAGRDSRYVRTSKLLRQSAVMLMRNLVMGFRPRCPGDDYLHCLWMAKEYAHETEEYLVLLCREGMVVAEDQQQGILDDLDYLKTQIYLYMAETRRKESERTTVQDTV